MLFITDMHERKLGDLPINVLCPVVLYLVAAHIRFITLLQVCMKESSSLIHGILIVIHESRFLFQINCFHYVIMENVIEISLICINSKSCVGAQNVP